VTSIPSSDGNSRTPPEIHEGPPNFAESNGDVKCSARENTIDTMNLIGTHKYENIIMK
jgi:hypothetical protein